MSDQVEQSLLTMAFAIEVALKRLGYNNHQIREVAELACQHASFGHSFISALWVNANSS